MVNPPADLQRDVCSCFRCLAAMHDPPRLTVAPPAGPLRLDLGCGPAKPEGFVGVDSREWKGVDVVCDLGSGRWPWFDASVDEVRCSHMVEHLKPLQRIHFANELHRVMKKGAKATIITPAWSSCRAYGDLTHEWPPVSEFWYPYLDKAWREANAAHCDGYTCDFAATWGSLTGPTLVGRSMAFIEFALAHYKEASQDLIATLVAK